MYSERVAVMYMMLLPTCIINECFNFSPTPTDLTSFITILIWCTLFSICVYYSLLFFTIYALLYFIPFYLIVLYCFLRPPQTGGDGGAHTASSVCPAGPGVSVAVLCSFTHGSWFCPVWWLWFAGQFIDFHILYMSCDLKGHHLFALLSFKTCMWLFGLWNRKEDFEKDLSVHTVEVNGGKWYLI